MADSEVNVEMDATPRGKKRTLTPSEWKKNKIKAAKVKGEAHISYNKKPVPERVQHAVQCRCRCFAKLTEVERQGIFESFSSLEDHEAQNVYLRGCVSVTPAHKIRRRPRKEETKERRSYVYRVTLPERAIPVCKAAFVGLHGIKMSRLKKKVLNFGSDIADGRGRHGNHPKIVDDVRNRVRDHIHQFLTGKSHQGRAESQHKSYLDSSLTIAEMHRMFLRENPDIADSCKYWLYQEVFNDEFNIAFGFTRSGMCDRGEKQQAQITAAEIASNGLIVKQVKIENELL